MKRKKRNAREHERRQEQRRRAGQWGKAGEWGMRCAHCGHGIHGGKCPNCQCDDFDF